MPLDPRTPVVVGVGQVTGRPGDDGPEDRSEPAGLMAEALRRAAQDAGSHEGTGAGRELLVRADSLRVVYPLSWPHPNPGLVVADRLGIEPQEQVLSAIGGAMPISLLHASARAIAAGRLDVALVTGAEAFRTRRLARREGRRLEWADPEHGSEPAPTSFGTERGPATEFERSRGIEAPVQAYPLLENALAAARGWGPDEQRRRIGRLWSSFSAVAATNPHAWQPTALTAEAIVSPGPSNRMVASPYPKLCTANMGVDQGAAFICCSVEAARRARVPEERWVFPWSGAEAHDHWFVSERPALYRSPAMAAAGHAALALAGVSADELGPVDLYSCFPVVVEMAADALGLPIDDPARPLTLTGGLTFAGGPGNNYAAHGLAAAVGRLREDPGTVGLVTGLGWYATKHAVAVLGARPPTRRAGRPASDGGADATSGTPYRWVDVQPTVDAQPRATVDPSLTGGVRVETHTVLYRRDGQPERAIVACRGVTGTRTWANVVDRDSLDVLLSDDWVGRPGTLGHDGVLSLG